MLHRFSASHAAFLGIVLLGIACGPSDRGAPASSSALPADPEPEISVSVAHRDEAFGAPTFAWLKPAPTARFKDHVHAARATVNQLAKAYDLDAAAVAALGEPDVENRAKGAVIARFEQRIGGVPVFRSGFAIALRETREPVAASGQVARRISGSGRPFALPARAAVANAMLTMGVSPALLAATSVESDSTEWSRFTVPGLREPARAKRVYFPKSATELEPAYYLEVQVARGDARSFVVSALDGKVLFQNDLTRYDSYGYKVWADPEDLSPMDGPQGNAFQPHPTGVPDKTKLTFVPEQLITLANAPFSKNDPWLPPAATTSDGNNVTAYADIVEGDGFTTPGDIKAAVVSGKLDHTYNTNASPGTTSEQIQASVTQLFYTTNYLHDWFYDSGFNEKARNHQKNNFTRGGSGNDPLLAEAQDYSGRNNANATVPADGSSPRLQMYIFAGSTVAEMNVTAPASIAGKKTVGTAGGFGKDIFDITGTVVLGSDDTGPDANDGCEPLAPATGKIVLVHRGTCGFSDKAKNAETAGAIGAIIVNVATSTQPTQAPFMGGTAPNISIPVLSLNLADGQALEGAIAQGVTVNMKRSGGVDVDGGIDTAISSHEWGHVLSGRLVHDGAGLTTNQSGGLGEGWADFTSLLVMARKDDPADFTGAYVNGSYAMSGGGDDIYFGTRRVPYSVDFAKNALTLKHIQNGVPLPTGVPTSFGEDGTSNAEAHNTGEVWATMLWECYVALLKDGRFTFEQARERMKRYLVSSLSLTPADPTLLEARDAVIAAAQAEEPKDAVLFWQAFARRGAGAGAVGPGKLSQNNVGVTESFSAGNAAVITSVGFADSTISCDHDGILDEGEVGTIEIGVTNAGSGDLTATKAVLSSTTAQVALLDTTPVPIPKLAPFAGTKIKLTTRIRAAAPLDVVDVAVTLDDPSFAQAPVAHVSIPVRYQADEKEASDTVDHVETSHSAWKIASDGTPDTRWSRQSEASNHFWNVPNGISSNDNRLITPPFTIDGTTFALTFRHRFDFRYSTRRNVDVDGGVLELTTDNGTTWKDLSELSSLKYPTTLDTGGRGNNPLKGRKAYGNRSPGYPDKWLNERVEVTLPAHPDAIQVRFRAGNGDTFATTAMGWQVDDIALEGITSKPFWSFVPQEDACDPNGPTVDAGQGRKVKVSEHVTLEGSGSSPSDKPLTFLWRQVGGPNVKLSDDGAEQPSFDAPASPGKLDFELRAHDGSLLSAPARVEIEVVANEATDTIPPASGDAEGGGCSCRTTGGTRESGSGAILGGLALVLASAARRRRRSERVGRTIR